TNLSRTAAARRGTSSAGGLRSPVPQADLENERARAARSARRHEPRAAEPQAEEDERWMDLALAEARLARDGDEVPVGAVVVLDGRALASDRNRTRERADPTAHAELL